MRIALINRCFSPTWGGGERYSWALAGRLTALGHEVHAFCGTYEEPQAGVQVHPLQYARFPRFRRITSFASAAAQAMHAPGLPQFDVSYALAPAYGADIFYMGGGSYRHWLRMRRPNPLWRWLNMLANPSSLAQVVTEEAVARGCGRVVAISRLVAGHAVAAGVAPERIEVVYTGYFEDEFSPEGREQAREAFRRTHGLDMHAPVGLFMGNFWARKGLDATLLALPEVLARVPEFRLVVAGKGDVGRYSTLARRLGVAQAVTFAGPTREPATAFKGSDFFVFPGLYDPGGAVILEAMACRTPVIASAMCGNAEIIGDGASGYVLPEPEDHARLAELMARLAADPELCRTMGEAAAGAVRNYSFDRVVDRLVEIFAEAGREKRAGE